MHHPNHARPALRAGYAPRAARQTVTQLLKHPEVAAALRAGMAARAERLRVHADRVLTALARIAFADIGNLVDWGPDGISLKPKSAVSADDRAAVAEIAAGQGRGGTGPRLRLHSKPRALDSIARHLGLYGRTAQRFVPPPPYEGRPAREIFMEKLMAMRVGKDDEGDAGGGSER